MFERSPINPDIYLVTDPIRLTEIGTYPFLITNRSVENPFKQPFIDRIKTDPFTGAVVISGKDHRWREFPDIETAINVFTRTIPETALIKTVQVNTQLEEVLPGLVGRTAGDIARFKQSTKKICLESGLTGKAKTIADSLGQNVNKKHTVIDNVNGWLNTIYKHIFSIYKGDDYSPVLAALLLERSTERFCLSQVLIGLLDESKLRALGPESLTLRYLRRYMVRTAPYIKAAAEIPVYLFGTTDKYEEAVFRRVINNDDKAEAILEQESVERYPEVSRVRAGRIEECRKLIADIIDKGRRELHLPVVQLQLEEV